MVVGFRLGSYEEGDFDVASVTSCCHIPERSKELARVWNNIASWVWFTGNLLMNDMLGPNVPSVGDLGPMFPRCW